MMKWRKMKWAIFLVSSILVLVSCKSTKGISAGEVVEGISTKRIILNHYENEADFETLRGKVKIDYFNGKSNQSVSVSFRMRKNRVIWISAPLGMVKAHITPEKVSFYNKLQGEYFDGDFGYLSQLLGTELDFITVQNLILGNALLDLRQDKYISSIQSGNYQLKPKKGKDFFKLMFQLEPKHFKIATQEIAQPEKDIVLSADYTYQDISGSVLPDDVKIVAVDQKNTTNIDLDFRNLELNKPLNFPYKVPKGYDQIILK